MRFKHEISLEILTTVLAAKTTAKEAWTRFIELHEEIVRKPYWDALKQIDIDGEQLQIVEWLTGIVTAQKIPAKITALWIGLVKLADNDENPVPTIYFGGADIYEDEDIDWFCDLKYLPDNRYAQPPLLQEIDAIAKTDKKDYSFLDWLLPLAYCAFTFDEIGRTKLDKNLFLKHQIKLFIAVGHDDGDYINLTPIEN